MGIINSDGPSLKQIAKEKKAKQAAIKAAAPKAIAPKKPPGR